MKKIRLSQFGFLFLIFLLLSIGVDAQRKVNGVVQDATNNSPMEGTTVSLKSGNKSVVTSEGGNFEISLPEGSNTLDFSFVGYESQSIKVGPQENNLVVMLSPSGANQLSDIVIVGYGTATRKSVTSSVSSINMAGIDKLPAASISQALSGKAAGLNVNLNSAQPGGNVTFQIRGAATGRSPLIIIDGMPTSNFSPATVGAFGTGSLDATLSSLNPADIESIDILKDASATAIYGSKGAGGVILITTKKGKKSSENNFRVNLNASTGIQQFYGIPKMLNAVEYMNETNRVKKEEWLYNRREGVYSEVPKPGGWNLPGAFLPYYSDQVISEFQNGTRKGTNFVDEVTRQGGVQTANLSVSGNSKGTRFYTSFNAFDQKGIIKNNDLTKYIGRLNVDQDFGKNLTGGITVNFSQINSDNVPIGNGGLYENSGILLSALQFDPTLPIYDDKGNFQKNTRQSNFPNPVSYLTITNLTQVQRFFNTAYLKYNILPGLSVKTQVGFDRTQSRSYGYLPTTTIAGMGDGGRAEKGDNMQSNYQFQLIANYTKTFNDKHNFTGLLGTEYMKYKYEGYGITATNFPYDGVRWNNLGLGANRPSVWSTGGNSETASYFSQLTYNYDYKYFVAVNLREDGSSNFSPKDRYGFFPGVSVGWDISQENFMENSQSWLNQLKLRVGYGETGNDNIGSAFSDWYAPGANTMWGSSVISGVQLAGLGNPDLKWEKQVDVNVGVDFSLFNSRVSGSIEYFNRVISRILGQKSLISSNPVNTIAYNMDAEKQTYGTELTINSRNISNANFSWNSLVTFTYYRDRWLKRDPSYILGINESAKQYIGELWYYKTDGLVPVGSKNTINPIPKTIQIQDVNGFLLDASGARVTDANGKPQYSGTPDGKINAADLVKVGVNTPYTIGFSNNLKYKDFDFAVDAYGMFNRWKNNSTKTTLGGPSVNSIVAIGSNLIEEVKGRWNSDNLNGNGVSGLQALTKYGAGDYFLEDAWFVRVKSISLGYTLPHQTLEKLKMRNIRVFANILNPFLFTDYSGMDPETDGYVAPYPNQRTYSFGIDLSL